MAAAIFGFVLPRISVLERDMVPPVDEFDSTRFGAYVPCQNYGFSVACNATKQDGKWQSLWQAHASQWYAPLEIRNGNITNDHYSTPFKRLDAVEHSRLLDTAKFLLKVRAERKLQTRAGHARKAQRRRALRRCRPSWSMRRRRLGSLQPQRRPAARRMKSVACCQFAPP